MRALPLGPEVASRVEALVGRTARLTSDGVLSGILKLIGLSEQSASLATRFAVAAAIILFNGMTLMGSWVTSRIEHAVVQNAASHLALAVEPALSAVAKDLGTQPAGSASLQKAVDAFLSTKAASGQIVQVKIWSRDGIINHTTDRALIGRSFPMFPELEMAFKGDVTAVYNDTRRDHLIELATRLKMPLFEIYVPIRANGDHEVVAVAEFYQNAELLEAELARSKKKTWMVVASLTLAMFGVLYAIVLGGSRKIDQQRAALERRIAEHEALNNQNNSLRQQLQIANRRGTELNERFLRRISSDLHDGPAQHLALALLRLDELVPVVTASAVNGERKNEEVLACIRTATADAMKEIRNISSGLALPELQKITPADALTIAARAHERATGTPVNLSMSGLPLRLPLPLTICLFRFAQEGLNNAFRHADGKDQRVRAHGDDTVLEVEVQDGGPGCKPDQIRSSERIGLAGLRHRVETLGGTLNIYSEPGRGTRLSARFPLSVSARTNA